MQGFITVFLCLLLIATSACFSTKAKTPNENTTKTARSFDDSEVEYGCDGVPNSGLVEDQCGVCDGPNDCLDCEGTAYGIAGYDSCGVCQGNGLSCVSCIEDSSGELDRDECGVCEGDGSSCRVIHPSTPASTNVTGCTSHKGKPYPWESSGLCTGNLLISIPIGRTGFELVQNSISPDGNFGFGASGFRLSIDKRLYAVNSSRLILEDGDQGLVHFSPGSGQNAGYFVADYRQLNANKIRANGNVFEEKSQSGVKYIYSPIASKIGNYGLTAIIELNGDTTTIARNAQGNILSVKNRHFVGPCIQYSNSGDAFAAYDADNCTVDLINPSIINYGRYNYQLNYSANLLSNILYPDGFSKWEIAYAVASSRIVTLKFNGGSTSINYYSTGMLMDVTDPEGRKVKYQYTVGAARSVGYQDNKTEFISARGEVRRVIDEGKESLFTYYLNKNLATATDSLGRRTLYPLYNSDGQPLEIELPSKSGTMLKEVFTYSNGNISSKTVQSNHSLGPVSQTTTYLYNAKNQILKIQGPGSYLKEFGYDSNGNLSSISVNNIPQKTMTYNSMNQLIAISESGLSTGFGSFDSSGYPTQISSALGNVTVNSTPSGLPLSITKPGYSESRIYDPMGRPKVVTRSSPGSGKDPYVETSNYTINKTETADNRGNGFQSNFEPTGASSQSTKAEGALNGDYSNGFFRSAPVYTNP